MALRGVGGGHQQSVTQAPVSPALSHALQEVVAWPCHLVMLAIVEMAVRKPLVQRIALAPCCLALMAEQRQRANVVTFG